VIPTATVKVKNLLSHLAIGGKYFDAYPGLPETDVPELEKVTYTKGQEIELPAEVALLIKARMPNAIQIFEPISPPKVAIKTEEELTEPEVKPKPPGKKKEK
jgi:hypothetical protein